MTSEPSYDPYWTAESVYCPGQDGSRPPICTDAMLDHFSTLLGRKVVSVQVPRVGHGVYNVVYGLVIEDGGQECAARICYNFKNTEEGREFARHMTETDVASLQVVANGAPELLVPRVLGYDTDPENALNAPFILQSKLHGINLLNTLYDDALSAAFDHRIFIPELATAFVQLFDIVLPQKIGQVVGNGADLSVSPTIGPFLSCEIFSGPGGPFSSAEDYMCWRIGATTWRETNTANVDVPALLDRLIALARRSLKHLERLDPLLLSIRPVHLDPHDRNVLVRDSHFAGLVDWQILALPAFMAAEYPPYLRSDGMYEARYAVFNEEKSITHMNSRLRPAPEEAKYLCSLYLEEAAKKSPMYAGALQEGKVLRQLIEWLNFVDWEGDFVWAGLELWEADQRAVLDGLERDAL
ncbi:hypothetical protein B0H19DRAFT_1179046 [Mycena capillaripes]|nr:hypothetical protein B0H19DRAFT_1179046 [Mycena capillaripes]